MSLRVIGAGWPRTGTLSLKISLERLLGGRCYHMVELFANLDQVAVWERALAGDMSGMHSFLTGYAAAVDWPASFFWRELLDANPEAIVVLSRRESAEQWWRSMRATIVPRAQAEDDIPGSAGRFRPMINELSARATGSQDFPDASVAMAAYEKHLARVHAECPADSLVEWTPGDGWAQLCDALGVPVPDDEFPHANTTPEFNVMLDKMMAGDGPS